MSEIKPHPYIGAYQEQWLEGVARVTSCHTNRASECGHPCARYLYYCRMNWEDRSVPPPSLQSLFELGKDVEDIVVDRWLTNRLGLQVIRPKDRDFSYRHVQLTGHIDCYVEEESTEDLIRPVFHHRVPDPAATDKPKTVWVPYEVKGVAIGTWGEINSFSDMLRSKRPWVRKWCGQLLMYLLMDEKPYGRFLFFSKEKGTLRDVPVILDEHLTYAEDILKRLELVNECVTSGTPPPRFYEPGEPSTTCKGCDFEHICLPEGSYEAALKIVENDVLLSMMDRYHEMKGDLEEAKKKISEFDELKVKLRTALEDNPNAIIGGYHVTGSWVKRKGKKSWWKWSYKKLEENP